MNTNENIEELASGIIDMMSDAKKIIERSGFTTYDRKMLLRCVSQAQSFGVTISGIVNGSGVELGNEK